MRAVRAAAAARRQGRNWAAGGGGMPKQKSKVGFSSCNARSTSLEIALLASQLLSEYVGWFLQRSCSLLSWVFKLKLWWWLVFKLQPASASPRTLAWDGH